MQQRRGTALQWSTANPVLAAGEIGFETDTSKFKIGNGSSTWTALTYFSNAAELAAIIDGAPAALNTLNELAAAMGDDPAFLTGIATNLSNHAAEDTDVHGIPDTSLLATMTYADTAVSTHSGDTTSVHGIEDTSLLATISYVTDEIASVTGDYESLAGAGIAWNSEDLQFDIDNTIATTSDITDHNADTTNVHGIADTSALATTSATSSAISTAVSTHSSDTTDVHGIADTSALATTSATASAISTAVSDHNTDETNVHGIADTSLLATKSYADTAEADAITAAGTAADSKIATAVAALTKSSVGLGNVDNTSDANKPVSTATQTALDAKA